MNKKELKKLEVERLSFEEISELGRSCGGNKKYVINASIEKIGNDELLVVDIYKVGWAVSGQAYPEYRVFIGVDDYVTKSFYHDWKNAAIENLLEFDYYRWVYCEPGKRHIVFNDDAHMNIEKFLNKRIGSKDLMTELMKEQKRIREIKLLKKHKKTTDKIDGVMAKVGSEPEDFKKFIDYDGFYFSNYIYYSYSRKKEKEGYCTHCRKDVKVKNIKNNKKIACPNCEVICTGKSINGSAVVRDYTRVELIQKFEEGIIVRTYDCDKRYEDFRKPDIVISEIRRTIFKNIDSLLELRRTKKDYEWGTFKGREVRWCDGTEWYPEVPAVIYSKNIKEVFKDTVWKYSALETMAAEKGKRISTRRFLYRYCDNKGYEDLIKHGLFNLTEELTAQIKVIVTKEKPIHKELLLDKDRFKMLINIDGGLSALEILQTASVRNMKITEEQIKFILGNYLPKESFYEVVRYMTPHKLIRYLASQSEEYEGRLRNTIIDYRDYLRDCVSLNYNMKDDYILFPFGLKQRHKETRLLVKIENNKEYEEAIKQIKEEIGSKYEYEDKEFKVIYPGTTADIIREGGELDHCVGGYIKSVVKRETNILFIRKQEEVDKSYYTLEVLNKSISQCRGYKNKDYKTDVKLEKFIKKYESKVLKNLIVEGNRNERISC